MHRTLAAPPTPAGGGAAPAWEPEPELVARLHAEYVAEVKALFERHKHAAGYGERELNVVAPMAAAAGSGATRKAKAQ